MILQIFSEVGHKNCAISEAHLFFKMLRVFSDKTKLNYKMPHINCIKIASRILK